ncbi:hypothetical protein IMAU30002_00765 [Lactobacillus helveticus]|nr:hypothetical protein [Lactobacillus helveticus]
MCCWIMQKTLRKKKAMTTCGLAFTKKILMLNIFYKRHGFEGLSDHTFQVGSDPQTDWLLLKNLR